MTTAKDSSQSSTAQGSTGATGNALITQNIIEQFLYREARYLDDREFERLARVLRRRRRLLAAVLGRLRHAHPGPAA